MLFRYEKRENTRYILICLPLNNYSIFILDVKPTMNSLLIVHLVLPEQNPVQELPSTDNCLKDVVDTDLSWICNSNLGSCDVH